MKLFTFFFFLVFSSQIFAKFESETEAKIDLSSRGYQTLKAIFIREPGVEESFREDIYFDIYQSGQYLLRQLNNPVRLRVMKSNIEIKWQVQKNLQSLTHSPFSFKETIVHEKIMTSFNFGEDVKNYFQHLDKTAPEALVLSKAIQQKLIEQQLIPAPSVFCEACKAEENYFPTHTNRKERLKLKITIQDETFKITLGKTTYKDKVFYELEAELKQTAQLERSAQRLKDWLLGKGLQIEDIIIENYDQTQDGLIKLNQIQSL